MQPGPFYLQYMADFDELYRVIHSIASGFKEEVVKCMEEHKNVLIDCIQEQLYSGLDGTEHLLNPDYDTYSTVKK